LMCYEHHQITNDVAAYSVERMRQIKTFHEAKFTDVARAIRAKIVDHTELSDVASPRSLARMNDVLGWGLSPEKLAECIAELEVFSKRVKHLPIPTREVLVAFIKRARNIQGSEQGVLLDEVRLALDLSVHDIRPHIRILDDQGFIDEGDRHDFGGEEGALLRDLKSGWPITADLKAFCDKTEVPLRDILVDLRFDVLD
jgi:hypothetical protein